MAFKKRFKDIESTQIHLSTIYKRNNKKLNIKKKCSFIISGLLISSTLLGFSSLDNSVYADDGNNNLKVSKETTLGNRKEVDNYSIQASNNIDTAIKVSQKGWTSATNIILVKDNGIADSLSVTPLAKALDAPILVTNQDSIPSNTMDEINRLGIKNVILIGGTSSISDNVLNTLKAKGLTVDRIGGNDRQDTSLQIAKKLNDTSKISKVAVTDGYKGLVDASSISAPAAKNNMAILFVDKNMKDDTKQFIDKNSQKNYVIGGASTIDDAIVKHLNATRLSGDNRKDTNAKVISEFYGKVNNAFITKDGSNNENQLMDALIVSNLAAKEDSVVVLGNNGLSDNQKDILKKVNPSKITKVNNGENDKTYSDAIDAFNRNDSNTQDNQNTPGIKVNGNKIAIAPQKDMTITRNYPKGGLPIIGTDIKGEIKVKYGDPIRGAHAYGCTTQDEYDKVLNWGLNVMNTLDLNKCPDFVYWQYYKSGNIPEDSYIDKTLYDADFRDTYRSWTVENKYLLYSLDKGIMSREDVEQLIIGKSALGHAIRQLPNTTDPLDGSPASAYDVIFRQKSDCDASAQVDQLISDLCGANGAIIGDRSHADFYMLSGNYWWINGAMPGNFKKNDNIFKMSVISAPAYNIDYLWK
ncbi:cell wall-binding repeat-containing protein [Clostridioides difficile]|uniref:cell wall-binding repeat-containing protein n=1 Tax=Clostridioides difficile TaxID=1496 RepID=UPI000D1E2EB9|nr:cell wall-binding repeat-containing protein [Clostridioides difficile]HBE9444649.1 cell wall-binding repeat-containing protein [Clostridioides difficile]